MPPRVPPGRAGRVWLVARLETGRRGAELLDRKRQALLRERAAMRAEARQAHAEWREAGTEAAAWITRATVAEGAGGLDVLARHLEGETTLTLGWANIMGARLPSVVDLALPVAPPLAGLGASAATVLMASACREATRTAARYAAAARALAEVEEQLRRTAVRLRALEERWIPDHERALAALDLALEESEREHAARVRWLTRRR